MGELEDMQRRYGIGESSASDDELADMQRRYGISASTTRLPLTPEKQAKVDRVTKAGLIPETKPSLLRETGKAFTEGDVGRSLTSMGDAFNRNLLFDAPNQVQRAFGGGITPEQREELQRENPASIFAGNVAAEGAGMVTGPAKLISSAAGTVAKGVGRSLLTGGASEAVRETIAGGDPVDIATAAGVGAATGGAFHGGAKALGKAAESARGRVDAKNIDKVREGVQAQIAAADRALPEGIPSSVISRELEKLQVKAASSGTKQSKAEADKIWEASDALWSDKGKLSAAELREEIQKLPESTPGKVRAELRKIFDAQIAKSKLAPDPSKASNAEDYITRKRRADSVIAKQSDPRSLLDQLTSARKLVTKPLSAASDIALANIRSMAMSSTRPGTMDRAIDAAVRSGVPAEMARAAAGLTQ